MKLLTISSKPLLLSAALAAAFVCSAQMAAAQLVVFNLGDGFENYSLGTAPGYNPNNAQIVGGNVGTSPTVPQAIQYTAVGTGDTYHIVNTAVTNNSSTNLSDYTLSFDFSLTVSDATNAPISFYEITLNNGTTSRTVNIDVSTATEGTGYVHFEYNLGAGAFVGFDPTVAGIGAGWDVILNAYSGTIGGGIPATNTTTTFLVDNFQVTVVPEPASVAMFVGGMSFMLFRRRRLFASR